MVEAAGLAVSILLNIIYGALVAAGVWAHALFVYQFFARRDVGRVVTGALGVAVIYLLLRDGFYWDLFAVGHGSLTINRASAGILYLAALLTAFARPPR